MNALFNDAFDPYSARMARYCKPFICSIIYGFDIVPRLSVPTLNDMKWCLLDALVNGNVQKFRLLGRGAKMLGFRLILPACCRPPSSIGMDVKLLNLSLQQRLVYPVVHWQRRSSDYTSEDSSFSPKCPNVNSVEQDQTTSLIKQDQQSPDAGGFTLPISIYCQFSLKRVFWIESQSIIMSCKIVTV